MSLTGGPSRDSAEPVMTMASGETVTVEVISHHSAHDYAKMIRGDAAARPHMAKSGTLPQLVAPRPRTAKPPDCMKAQLTLSLLVRSLQVEEVYKWYKGQSLTEKATPKTGGSGVHSAAHPGLDLAPRHARLANAHSCARHTSRALGLAE